MALEWLAAPLMGLVQTAGNIAGAERQAKHNKDLAAFQHSKNMELLKYQLDYNTPAMQMQRFKDAGLNPNLVYGQGNPGNMSSAPSYPDIRPSDYQGAVSGAITQMADLAIKSNQAKLLETQAGLNETKIDESTVKQSLMAAQRDLVKSNPYMRKEYVNAMVLQLESLAKLKAQEASFMTDWTTVDGVKWQRGYLKMQRDLDSMLKKLNIQSADLAVKARIIEGKEFDNILKEVQARWMKDGDITPQHVYQGIAMLIRALMSK